MAFRTLIILEFNNSLTNKNINKLEDASISYLGHHELRTLACE